MSVVLISVFMSVVLVIPGVNGDCMFSLDDEISVIPEINGDCMFSLDEEISACVSIVEDISRKNWSSFCSLI